MPFIDFNTIPRQKVWEGIHGAIQHSDHLTFAHITLEQGAIVKLHQHIHEQWTHVLEGQLEFTLGEETKVLSSGMTAYIPSDIPHCAKAITLCKVLDCFHPVREDFKTLEAWTPMSL